MPYGPTCSETWAVTNNPWFPFCLAAQKYTILFVNWFLANCRRSVCCLSVRDCSFLTLGEYILTWAVIKNHRVPSICFGWLNDFWGAALKYAMLFWKLISASCDVLSFTYLLPLPRALHIRSVVGHLISCYRISKFPPTASKGCSAAAAAAVAPRRGSCSRWLHKALGIWRRNKLMLKRNKQSTKERKQRWECFNVFSAQSPSTSPAVCPVIMCR